MDILEFFDSTVSLRRVQVPGARVRGNVRSTLEPQYQYEEQPVMDDASQYDYAQDYRDEEEALCFENNSRNNQESDLLRPDSPTTINTAFHDTDVDAEITDGVYAKYNFNNKPQNKNIAIKAYQEEITDMISSNSVIVIQGPTGCGKSTQVPQFILDHCQSQKKYCNIAVTQPRRIAATSVARRVSEERGWPVGTVVGYQVALERENSADTILTYMTTGVLLQRLVGQGNMSQYTHILIDEVHERDSEMDFLLLVVRRFLRTNSKTTKVVLMSATFDVDVFSDYFRVPKGDGMVMAPVIDITKMQPYTVNVYYLNQFKQLLDTSSMPDFSNSEPMIHRELHQVVLRLLRIFNTFEKPDAPAHGSVLVFLPGIREIEEMYEILKNSVDEAVKWFIVPLHSSITIEEQRRAFEDPPQGFRKIILSTNIAESSVTVPDVVYVIDFCLTKVLICDANTNYSSLKLMWASHTNCQQRAGRVGRVCSGRVYRLVPQEFYDELDREIIPEMLRSPLHRLVLMSKRLNLDLPPHGVLGLAISRPPIVNIERTIMLLKEAGALLTTCDGKYDPRDGDLTYLGEVMSFLPLDISVSKLITLGYMFGTLKECIIMACAMSLQNIFSVPFNNRMAAYMSKLYWADCACSDLIVYLHVFIVWEKLKRQNSFRNRGAETKWMKRNYLQPRIMQEWRILVDEIKRRLERNGITEPIERRATILTEHEKAMMLKVVISGAFYPNYFVRSSEGGQVDEGLAVRQLGGRDPYTTVYLTGKPDNQPAQLYAESVKELLKECGQNMHVSFDGSNKIYVQFKHDNVPNQSLANNSLVPGKVAIEVYNAVKLRFLKLPMTVPCLSSEDAKYRVKQWKEQQASRKQAEGPSSPVLSVVPSMGTLTIEIQVSHVNTPGHFYAHNVDDVQVMTMLTKIDRELNGDNQLLPVDGDILVGKVYAAPYERKYYRARASGINMGEKNDNSVQVLFIDYGNIECIPKNSIKMVPAHMQKIPPLAMECVMTGIQPSHEMNAHALWSQEAINQFSRITNQGNLYGKVYSVVDNIVSLELYRKTNSSVLNTKSLNQWLIENSFAEPANESFLSQDNHKRREEVQNNRSSYQEQQQQVEFFDNTDEMPAPSAKECKFSFTLKGPFSPLEMQVFSVVQCSTNKSISVEWNSVNSVLLDSNPQDPHDRLLVAGAVNQTDNCKLSLRHTTIMPNILGFPVFMALIFCPKMEFHTNKEGTRLTSVLCGLGKDPVTKQSLFPAHDLALNLDFEFTEEDIVQINEIRFFMNKAVQAMGVNRRNTEENHASVPVDSCQNEIRQAIRKLLNFQHVSREREILPNTFVWGKVPAHLEVLGPDYTDEKDSIWTMHMSLRLLDDSQVEVTRHLAHLRDVAKNSTTPVTEIECKLCQITLHDVVEMRLHLVSSLHQENETEFHERN